MCQSQLRCQIIGSILEDALEDTRAGGIAAPLKYDQFIVRSFDLDIFLPEDGILEIYFEANPDKAHTPETVRDVFVKTLKEKIEFGIPQDTLDRLIKNYKKDLEEIIDSPDTVHEAVIDLVKYNKPSYSLRDEQKEIQSITAEEINRFAKHLLEQGRTIIRFYYPEVPDE